MTDRPPNTFAPVPLLADDELPFGLGYDEPSRGLEDFAPLRHIEGTTPGWPIGYDALEPYYSRAEQLYRVRGDAAQDPTEPLPYRVEEVTFDNPDAGIRLAGTLTLPYSSTHDAPAAIRS